MTPLEAATELRRSGMKYREIANQVGKSVDWCKRQLKGLRKVGPANVPDEVTGKHTVYVFYSNSLEVLYVGRTSSFGMRWRQHIAHLGDVKVQEIAFIEVNVMSTPPEEAFYEQQMILCLKPKWNKKATQGSASGILVQPCARFVLEKGYNNNLLLSQTVLTVQ